MTRYYISDCHFYHESINERMDKRGFLDVYEMNEYMIKQWNLRVRKGDEVIVLGDFSWGGVEQTKKILDQLKGKIYLIQGNHDKFARTGHFEHPKVRWIRQYAEVQDNNRKVIVCHYPIMCYNGQYRRDTNGDPRVFMLHGHVHNTRDQKFVDLYTDFIRNQEHKHIWDDMTESIPCELINCFCQYSDYVPLTLDEWRELNEKRREEDKRERDKYLQPGQHRDS